MVNRRRGIECTVSFMEIALEEGCIDRTPFLNAPPASVVPDHFAACWLGASFICLSCHPQFESSNLLLANNRTLGESFIILLLVPLLTSCLVPILLPNLTTIITPMQPLRNKKPCSVNRLRRPS